MQDIDLAALAISAAPEAIDVPEWGGRVYMRPLRMADLLAIQDDKADRLSMSVRMVRAALCKPDGSAWDAAALAKIEQLPAAGLLRLVAAMNRLSGFDQAALGN